MLDAEQRIADAGRERGGYRLDPAIVTAVLAQAANRGRALNDGQATLVRAFCCSGRRVQLGLAPAGTGKTTAMKAVTDAWRAAGRPVVALAPSAAAADVLSQELGVAADTLAKFDYDQPTIKSATLILVDEAGMAGTLILDRLVVRARAAGAVVRLVGDDQQLAAMRPAECCGTSSSRWVRYGCTKSSASPTPLKPRPRSRFVAAISTPSTTT